MPQRKSGIKKFDGKNYEIWGLSHTKAQAVEYAEDLREKGYLARVEKTNKVYPGWPSDTGWITYVRKK